MVSHGPAFSLTWDEHFGERERSERCCRSQKKMKQTLAFMRMVCQKLPRILNQDLMKTENISVAPEATAAKQAWAAPTLDCLSVSLETALTSVTGMDGGPLNMSNT